MTETDDIRQAIAERNDELPGPWTTGIGEGGEGTYTHWYYNDGYGAEAEINIDWEELQLMDGEAERQEFIDEWLGGEEPEKYDSFPEAAEMEVYTDPGEPHTVVLTIVERYPDDHEYSGDVVMGTSDYPEATRTAETAEEAEQLAIELMKEYQ